jgi:hypothetical protein
MPNLVIIGQTSNGKTMIVEKFRRDHPSGLSVDGEHEVIPVVLVQMPSEPDLKRFYAAILRAVQAPPRPPRELLARVEDFTLRLLQRIGVRVLIIDEVHNLLGGSSAQQRAFLNVLRSLGNTLCIPLVCVGTREAYLAIRSDEQLENRFEPFPYPAGKPMQTAPVAGKFRATFLCATLALEPAAVIDTFSPRAKGPLEKSRPSARAAIWRPERAGASTYLLSQVDYHPPSDLRCVRALWPRAREMTRWPLHPARKTMKLSRGSPGWRWPMDGAHRVLPWRLAVRIEPSRADESPPARLLTTLVDHTGWSRSRVKR